MRSSNLLLLLGALLLSAPAAAQDAEPPAWGYSMAHDLMSPYCPGRTLHDCPSPQADELRLWILTQAAGGATREEVERILEQRYGDAILSAPRADGFGITAYGLPVLGFLLGGGLLALSLRRLVGPSPADVKAGASTAAAPAVDPEIEAAIDRELSKPS